VIIWADFLDILVSPAVKANVDAGNVDGIIQTRMAIAAAENP
jgi:hypothetical protein